MAIIEKKIWPEYFEKVLGGEKKFELRLNDFEVRVGDTLLLREFDPSTKAYTGRSIEKRVGYVMRFKPDTLPFYSLEAVNEKGLQIISLEDKGPQ